MTVEETSPHEKRCANAACGGTLEPRTKSTFWKCSKCLILTCVVCEAIHEGKNCSTYQRSKAQRDKGTAVPTPPEATSSTEDRERGACGGKAVAGTDKDTEEEAKGKTMVEPFVPGKAYTCGADGCTYETVLHHGSWKFWCPWCYVRHEIKDNQLFKYKQIDQAHFTRPALTPRQ